MGSLRSELDKPHAVCIPYPAQGHINPMLKLAKILHQKGFHITFVNTEFNHRRLQRTRGPESLRGLPSFRFETIPDGLPPSDADSTQDIPSLCESTSATCLGPFKDLLARLNDTAVSNAPPVSCIVSDGVMSFTVDAAEELGIPEVLFWTTSACGFLGYMHYTQLLEKGYFPFKDESYLTNGYLETELDWVKGMKGIRLRDLPSFFRTTNPDEYMFKFLLQETGRAGRASAVILNTFDALEHEALMALKSMLPAVYTVGPLQFLQTETPPVWNGWTRKRQTLKWGIGREIDSNVKRDEVEKLVRELMEGEKGGEMKKKAMEWKKLAEEAATSSIGSSHINIEKLINLHLLPPKY
nr:7-deoxyloganetin glucosyltransferase-like [Ipomoea batatas]